MTSSVTTHWQDPPAPEPGRVCPPCPPPHPELSSSVPALLPHSGAPQLRETAAAAATRDQFIAPCFFKRRASPVSQLIQRPAPGKSDGGAARGEPDNGAARTSGRRCAYRSGAARGEPDKAATQAVTSSAQPLSAMALSSSGPLVTSELQSTTFPSATPPSPASLCGLDRGSPPYCTSHPQSW
jgi:hypothetical protein